MIHIVKRGDHPELVDVLDTLLRSSTWLLRSCGWLLRKLWVLFLGLLKLRSRLLIVLLSGLLTMNVYFILTLLSAQKHVPKHVRGYNHGFNTNNHGFNPNNHGFNRDGRPVLNRADRVMLGHDTYVDSNHANGDVNNNNDDDDVTQYTELTFDKYSNKCTVLQPSAVLNVPTPYKIYVYDDLPAELNAQLSECVTKYRSPACYRADHCGYGPETGISDNGLLMHGTWQFNLEVILHHKLLHSPYRTHNPSEAEVFYVPYYAAHACYCYSGDIQSVENNIGQLHEYLNKSPYYRAGKPHVTTIGKIEREHFDKRCPLLTHLNNTVFRVIGIEEETGRGVRQTYSKYLKPVIVAPYPSYGHYDSRITPQDNIYRRNIAHRDRTVYMFIAAGQRRSNKLRAQILDNILGRPHTYRTPFSYEQFLYKKSQEDKNFTNYIEQQAGMLETVWLTTPECRGQHHRYTLDWMRRALFCLQPPGDSPTRKSFYDAILAGCIPVLFTGKRARAAPVTRYPFSRHLDYSAFTVTLTTELATRHNVSIATLLSRLSPGRIRQVQEAVAKASQFLQYSFPIVARQPHEDALKYILDEVGVHLRAGW